MHLGFPFAVDELNHDMSTLHLIVALLGFIPECQIRLMVFGHSRGGPLGVGHSYVINVRETADPDLVILFEHYTKAASRLIWRTTLRNLGSWTVEFFGKS